MPARKRSLPNEGEGKGGSGGSPKKSRTSKEAKPLDPKKFGGKTEEEICQMLLPDHMAPGLDIIFVSQATLKSVPCMVTNLTNQFADGYQSGSVFSLHGTPLLQRQ